MPICAPGTSQPIPGYQSAVYVTAAAVEAALLASGVGAAAAAAISGVVAFETYDLVTLCGSDPPADPVITATDLLDAINWADPTVSIPAIARLRQWFRRWYWWQVCECVGAPTPAEPPLTLPPGVSTNPGLPSGPTGAPCWNVSNQTVIPPGGTLGNGVNSIITLDYLPGPLVGGMTGSGPITQAGAIPSGASNLHISIDQSNPLTNFNTDSNFAFYNAAKAFISGQVLATNTMSTSWSLAIPATAVYWTIYNSNDATNGSTTIRMTVSYYCAGQSPTSITTPCCPPDPTLETTLNRILGLVETIYESLPGAFRGYSTGTVHAGLTGSGHIATNPSTIAIRVDITSDTSGKATVTGDPSYLFDRGYIVAFVDSMPLRRQVRLVYSPQLYQLPELTNEVGYGLTAGVTATITELSRAP